MKKLNISKHTFLILIFVSAVLTAQTNNEETDTTKPTQYRRSLPLQNNYQTYEEKYTGKDLEEIKRSLFPLRSTGVWTELNPGVPRVDYLGIYFVDTLKGWAVGSLGTIIYSTNSGKKWRTSESPVNNVLLHVHSYNGQTVVASGYNGTIVRSTDGGITWVQVSSGVTGDLWEIKMINDTLGWACGTGPSLLKTTNGGENWEIINTGFSSFNYWALDFIDKNILYIAGNGGNILRTTNGGNNWELIQTGYGKNLYRIKAFNQQRIITGGEMGWITYTSDGGVVWDTSTAGGIIDAMAFLNDSVGYVTGNLSPNFIYKTTNGGESWAPKHVIEIGNYSLTFVNETLGFSSGLNLSIQKTTDGGENWEKSILNDNFYDVNFLDEYTGFIISGSLYKTTDGGESWEKKQTGPGGFSINFIDGLTGFIGNNNGSIQKTTDGGASWYAANSDPSAGQITKFLFWNDSVGCALGGKVLKTTDKGESWIAKDGGGTSIFFIDTLVGWITRLNAYPLKTTDGGEIWIEKSQLIDLRDSRDVYFLDQNIGWVISHNIGRKLFKTTNGGISFFNVLGISGPFNFNYFPNKFHWLINGTQKYETVDSGNIWVEITSSIPIGFNKFHAPTEAIGYAIGSTGVILKYIDSLLVPVELSSFTGDVINGGVRLKWSTVTEVNNKGFYIEKSFDKIIWGEVGFKKGSGTTTENNFYSFTDKEINSPQQFYRLKQVDFNGKHEYSEVIGIETDLNIQNFRLFQNYPNPFNSNTVISYQVPTKSFINISLYSVIGEKIYEIINEEKAEGIYKETFISTQIPSGVYFLKMKTSTGFSAINKITLIK